MLSFQNRRGASQKYQFRLKAIFAVILGIGVPLGGVAHLKHQVEDFHRAAEPFERLTGREVRASTDGLGIYKGRRGILRLNLRDSGVTDADLLGVKADLEQIPDLRQLLLARTRITDIGLRAITNLRSLRTLDLGETAVSDRGLEDLAGLQLTSLNLSGTQITDAGLVILRRQAYLEEVGLCGTKVSDAAVEDLQLLLPSCRIER